MLLLVIIIIVAVCFIGCMITIFYFSCQDKEKEKDGEEQGKDDLKEDDVKWTG